MACVKHATASRVLRSVLHANWYGSFGRVVIEPILFNNSDSRTLRGTGLHVVGCIFGQAAEDDFLGREVIIIVRQVSGSTPVLMDSWNKSVKTANSSLGVFEVEVGEP